MVEDIYCEPNLLTVMFLSCGRPNITKYCVKTFIDSIYGFKSLDIEYIFLEQGWDQNYGDSEENLTFFQSLELDRKIILINDKNYGINCGINNIRRLSRGEYILFLENDWVCCGFNGWLDNAVNFLKEEKDVGILQLRALDDYHGNSGLGKPDYNPFSCMSNIMFKDYDGYRYMLSKFKYPNNNNPAIWRKKIYNILGSMPEPELWSDLRHGETEYEKRWEDYGLMDSYFVAHPQRGIFYHYR